MHILEMVLTSESPVDVSRVFLVSNLACPLIDWHSSHIAGSCLQKFVLEPQMLRLVAGTGKDPLVLLLLVPILFHSPAKAAGPLAAAQ